MTPEYVRWVDLIQARWGHLRLYELNADQVWVAESLAEAFEYSAEKFGCPVQDVADEMSPPRLIGALGEVLGRRGVDSDDLLLAQTAGIKLAEGYLPPIQVIWQDNPYLRGS